MRNNATALSYAAISAPKKKKAAALTLTFIKSLRYKREQVQHFFSPLPLRFFAERVSSPGKLLPVSLSTLIFPSRSLFVLKSVSDKDFPKKSTRLQQNVKSKFFRHLLDTVEIKQTYCAGSGSRWSPVDTCRCSLWRCPLWKIHWSRMPLCCGRGSDGRDLQGEKVESKTLRSLALNKLRRSGFQQPIQMWGQNRHNHCWWIWVN